MPQKKIQQKNSKPKAKKESRLKSQKTIQKEVQKPQPKPNKPEIRAREFDAKGLVLGRLASEIAVVLRGKDMPNFRPNLVIETRVTVKNASKIVLTGKKIEQKVYQRHTGYLGHLKTVTLKEKMAKNPSEVLRHAVYGMLPKNRLRGNWLKNLKIEN